jgi:hypothetical protein
VTGGFSHANCETMADDFFGAARSRRPSSAGPGFHHFAYSISDDGACIAFVNLDIPAGRD